MAARRTRPRIVSRMPNANDTESLFSRQGLVLLIMQVTNTYTSGSSRLGWVSCDPGTTSAHFKQVRRTVQGAQCDH